MYKLYLLYKFIKSVLYSIGLLWCCVSTSEEFEIRHKHVLIN